MYTDIQRPIWVDEFIGKVVQRARNKERGLVALIGPVRSGKTTAMMELACKIPEEGSPPLPIYYPYNYNISNRHDGIPINFISKLYNIKDLPKDEIILVDELALFCYTSSDTERAAHEVVEVLEDRMSTSLIIVATFDLFWDLSIPEVAKFLLMVGGEPEVSLASLTSRCSNCGGLAAFSYKVNQAQTEKANPSAEYVPLCKECHPLLNKHL